MSKFFPFNTQESLTLSRVCPQQGTATTRAGVFAEVRQDLPVGTLYQSTSGKLYQKVANAGVSTDWQRATSTAAD